MPTYAYACRECDHRFEVVQSFSDDSLTVCPVCDGSLRKVFNSVGVVFKGGGFYRNDSRAASSNSSPAASTGASSDSGSSESSSSTPAASGAKSDAKSGSKSSTTPASSATSNASA